MKTILLSAWVVWMCAPLAHADESGPKAGEKVPALKALAPTGSEPPFAAAQGVVLLVFLVLGILAFRRFRDTPSPATP